MGVPLARAQNVLGGGTVLAGKKNGEDQKQPKRGRNPVATFFSVLLLCAALGVFGFSAWKLWGFYTEYKAGSDEYQELNDQFVRKDDGNDEWVDAGSLVGDNALPRPADNHADEGAGGFEESHAGQPGSSLSGTDGAASSGQNTSDGSQSDAAGDGNITVFPEGMQPEGGGNQPQNAGASASPEGSSGTAQPEDSLSGSGTGQPQDMTSGSGVGSSQTGEQSGGGAGSSQTGEQSGGAGSSQTGEQSGGGTGSSQAGEQSGSGMGTAQGSEQSGQTAPSSVAIGGGSHAPEQSAEDPNRPQIDVQLSQEAAKPGRILTKIEDLEDPETVEEKKEEAATLVVVENRQKKQLPRMRNPIEFGELLSVNKDVVGWLRVGGIKGISYPICQGEDNDYYLHRTFRREDNFAGCIFLNCDNTRYLTDQNTIIYGHNMKDGSMFGSLKELKEQEVYDKNPYFWVYTPEMLYQYRIFSTATVSKIGDPYRTRFNTKDFAAFLKNSLENSYIDAKGVTVGPRDRIVTLSTCTGDDSTRFIVQGVLEQVYAAR